MLMEYVLVIFLIIRVIFLLHEHYAAKARDKSRAQNAEPTAELQRSDLEK